MKLTNELFYGHVKSVLSLLLKEQGTLFGKVCK